MIDNAENIERKFHELFKAAVRLISFNVGTTEQFSCVWKIIHAISKSWQKIFGGTYLNQ